MAQTTTISVEIPTGRKALVLTHNIRYDEKGNWLGYEVIEVEKTFNGAEAERLKQVLGCPECGGIGKHQSYWVRTGQDGFGTVEGYTRQCSRAGKS